MPTWPKPMPAGGQFALVAPAGPGSLEASQAHAWADHLGYRLRIYPGVFEKAGYLAGSDERRLADLHAAFADPEVDAILCLRGGYGTPRLLDRLDIELIRANPKPFVGYSDITALHLAFNQLAGLVTFHGPLFRSELLPGLQPGEGALLAMLQGQPMGEIAHPSGWPLKTVAPGRASGHLAGGNLSLLCATLGTPWALQSEGAVLFIEDVNEPLYRVDRLLTQLRLAGKLHGLAGVLVGDFAGISTQQLQPLLAEFFTPLGVPVLAGWRSGHCQPNLTLPMGAQVVLDASERRLLIA
ncbi:MULTISPECIES: LD-carboxypeptidase [unclassified Pseudomonas]|uniref:S66 peptidase family protein n=1 Tax=unclassified Pseudomonas TaxID=196821 RepID=UPI000BDA1A07|nr:MULTISPECIES: LD-carboxypeptidase [unclassified Pseudomonas]PVZ15654.1 muramoyltetrapeptide carboxypeptidase [Pseudomonas sp. URIL14HWK12:I12]PVZ25028.1 muramoyltetrapeptide carboxypeptidase [Pseudomonas sp. URIL14HWK12:I10]PVZ34874.1 muramoyltetrapeptide carboxypeptidase [Pseudomonas sp. URIL14HWK12:I11]SNZ09530.1 muramoyltetrapeptide carboxypeptidase [Pseudomonas sp. URIL14HWK12:I9]